MEALESRRNLAPVLAVFYESQPVSDGATIELSPMTVGTFPVVEFELRCEGCVGDETLDLDIDQWPSVFRVEPVLKRLTATDDTRVAKFTAEPFNLHQFDDVDLYFRIAAKSSDDFASSVEFRVATTILPDVEDIDGIDRLMGDANTDGKVDFADFLILSGNFGLTENTEFGDGDFDESGAVDFADFLTLSRNFGASLNE